MQKSSKREGRFGILICLFILGLITVVTILPCHFGAAAANKGLIVRTESHSDALPNYDIRSAAQSKTGQNASDLLASWQDRSGKNAVAVADFRDSFVRGEESLKERVPNLKVEYNEDIRTPEVIGTDVKM